MANSARKTAIVTGGNRGIGLEVCRQLAEQGYQVVLTARDVEHARRAAAGLGGAGLVRAEQLDVTDPASVARLASWAATEAAPIHALVNNAGISMKGFDAEVVYGTLAVNFFGALYVTQALTPLLADGGSIVMVSSGMGELSAFSAPIKARFLDESLTIDDLVELVGEFERDVKLGQHTERGWPSSAYRVSKAALNALTRISSRQHAGLHVNSVCPGWVKTDMGGPGANRTVDQGASGVVWAATLGEGGPTGGFFRDAKPLSW